MTSRSLSLAGIGLALVLGLAACSSVDEAPAAADATAVSGAAESADVTEVSTAAPVAVKTALEATDPATVQLAAGRPQLIEFFAFW